MTTPTAQAAQAPVDSTHSGEHWDALSPAARLWQAVAAVHARLADVLDGDGLSCSVLGSDTVAILLPLSAAPEHQLRMNELAERSHLTPSGLTRRIDRLEADALVARQTCPGDRRGAFARLTPKGFEELRRALPHHTQTLQDFVGPRMDDEEITRLAASLERLAAATHQE